MREGEEKNRSLTLSSHERGAEKKSLLEWLPFGKEFGAFLLLFHIVVVGTCFAFFSYFGLFYYVVQTTFTSDIRKEKGKGPSQQSSTFLRFREMPSVCVGSGKIKYVPFLFLFFLRERRIFFAYAIVAPVLTLRLQRAPIFFGDLFDLPPEKEKSVAQRSRAPPPLSAP